MASSEVTAPTEPEPVKPELGISSGKGGGEGGAEAAVGGGAAVSVSVPVPVPASASNNANTNGPSVTFGAVQVIPPTAVTVDTPTQVRVGTDASFASDISAVSAGTTTSTSTTPSTTDMKQMWTLKEYKSIPMSILIMIVGSRGDVQPFVALGKMLKNNYGHRVRLATHETFRKFVTVEGGLEFYPIAGDPAELMAYMVKNPGLLPGFDSIKAGDISQKRKTIAAILESCWDACYKPDPGPPKDVGNGNNASKSNVDQMGAGKDTGTATGIGAPFVAQMIISNPVTFAHVHCAQKLRVPLHIMFTMPWTPTKSFPHPLIQIIAQSDNPSTANYYSYSVVENLTWSGVGDIINNFRKNTLALPIVTQFRGPYLLSSHPIPHTYTWSPELIPKPDDWCYGTYKQATKEASRKGGIRMNSGSSAKAATATMMRRTAEDRELIDVSGFLYLDSLTTGYTPPADLADFLVRKTNKKIVYIGFGSIVIPDPNAFTKLILEAVKKAGVRALVSQGWGGLGMSDQAVEVIDGEKQVMVIGNTPHDWLFLQIDAVVHHGGAGTTAAGLKAGRPTMVVPFFGDQPFWGSMVHRMGVGASPIPFKKLTAANLAKSIMFCCKPEVRAKAEELGVKMREETGTLNACRSIHRHLPLSQMTCDIFPDRLATHYTDSNGVQLKVCKQAMDALIEKSVVNKRKWKRRDGGFVKWNLDDVPSNIFTGTFRAGKDIAIDCGKAVAYFFVEPAKGFKKAAQVQGGGKKTAEAFKGIGKGIGKFIYFPLKAGAKALGDISDGLRNTPNAMEGIPLEARKNVNNAWEGFYRGGQALVQGTAEGVWDLFSKPVTVSLDRGPAVGIPLGLAVGATSLAMKPVAGAADFVVLNVKGIRKSIVDLNDPEGAKRRQEANEAHKKVGIEGGVDAVAVAGSASWPPPPQATPSSSSSLSPEAVARNAASQMPSTGKDLGLTAASNATTTTPSSETPLTLEQKAFVMQRFNEIKAQQAHDRESRKRKAQEARAERREEIRIAKEAEKRAKAGEEVKNLVGSAIQVDRVVFGDENDVISKGSI